MSWSSANVCHIIQNFYTPMLKIFPQGKMDPNWPQHFKLEVFETYRSLSREPVLVLGLTHTHKGKANQAMGKYVDSFARKYLDTCFICFLLLLKIDQNDLTLIGLCFCFTLLFIKSQTCVIKIFNSKAPESSQPCSGPRDASDADGSCAFSLLVLCLQF